MRKLLLFFMLVLTVNLYANSYKYLELGVDARSFVMGHSSINNIKGSGAAIINPAGIDSYKYNWILISHLNWFFNSTLENLEIGFPIGENFYSAAGVIYFSTDDFDILNSNGDTSYSFNSYDMAIYSGIGKNFGVIKFGLNGKLLKKKLGDYDSTGFTSDFGVRIFGNIKDRLSINLVVKNILFVPIKMINFENYIKREFIVGGEYNIIKGLEMLISAKIGYYKPEFNFSMKYNLFNFGSIYTGYSMADFNSVGMGFTYKYIIQKKRVLFFDIGYLKTLSNDFEDDIPLRFSVRYIY